MPCLQKIDQIKGYKSYGDYQWTEFGVYKKNDCSDEQQVEFDPHFNVIFGENGSGKSCIAEVLKSLACARDFKASPSSVKLSFKDEGGVIFDESSGWSKIFLKNEFIFFDSDFVSKNVHTHGTRDGTFGGHKQNAGELILSVDEEYERLRKAIREAKDAWHEQNNNPLVLEPDLTDSEKPVFEKMRILEAAKQATRKSELLGAQREKNEEIEALRRNQQQLTEIAGISWR